MCEMNEAAAVSNLLRTGNWYAIFGKRYENENETILNFDEGPVFVYRWAATQLHALLLLIYTYGVQWIFICRYIMLNNYEDYYVVCIAIFVDWWSCPEIRPKMRGDGCASACILYFWLQPFCTVLCVTRMWVTYVCVAQNGMLHVFPNLNINYSLLAAARSR